MVFSSFVASVSPFESVHEHLIFICFIHREVFVSLFSMIHWGHWWLSGQEWFVHMHSSLATPVLQLRVRPTSPQHLHSVQIMISKGPVKCGLVLGTLCPDKWTQRSWEFYGSSWALGAEAICRCVTVVHICAQPDELLQEMVIDILDCIDEQ